MKDIISYLQSIQYVIGDLNEKVEELSTTQKEHIDKTMKELSNNQTRIRSINNKVVEIKQIIEPIKQDIESKWLGYFIEIKIISCDAAIGVGVLTRGLKAFQSRRS